MALPPAAAARTTRATAAPVPASVATASATTSASPYWTAFDQELIDSVLFPPITSGLLVPPPSFGDPSIVLPLESPSPVSTTDGMSPMAMDTTADLQLQLAPTETEPATKPKRKRKYTESTRAKHREVQRRFIMRKKEKAEQEKKLATMLEKQVQLINLRTEAATLERERSSLLQQCIANGVDLDTHDMSVFLEEEMDTLSQYYTPLQPSESSAILQQTLRYIDGFCPDEAFLDDGVNIAGWNQQSRVEHKTISFRIGKDFPESFASQVFERTGYAMATVTFFSQFFGSTVVIKTKLLQLIDLNTVILYRAIYHPVTKEISRSVELLCRVQRGDGYLILMQSLEGLNIQNFVGTQDTWIRGVVWCQISPKQPGRPGCMIQWTGCVGQCPVESLEHWRRDLVFLVLRYESLVVAPLVTLSIDDGPTGEDAAKAVDIPDNTSQATSHDDTSSIASPRPVADLKDDDPQDEPRGDEDDDNDDYEGEDHEGGTASTDESAAVV